MVSGERPNVSQEVVFQTWATSPTQQPDDVSIPVGAAAEQIAHGAHLQVDDAHRVEVPVRRFAIGSDTDSIGSPGDLEGDVDGSFASGDEEVFEVPVVEMVPPVRPSAATMRACFMGLDDWNLEELFSHRGSLMRSIPRFLWDHSAWQQSWRWKRFSMEWNAGVSCN